MQASMRRSNVKWFSTRQKSGKNKRRSPMQLLALRMNDLAILFRSRYGTTLPDDDAGRDDLAIAVNHLACLPHPQRPIERWIEIWTPWLTVAEQREIVPPILANPDRWKADALAWRLRLTMEERMTLGITTIGAVDQNKGARIKRRRKIERERKAKQRRAKGMKPRKLYEEQSISQNMPWLDEGVSRATWYRRKKAAETDETTPVTP